MLGHGSEAVDLRFGPGQGSDTAPQVMQTETLACSLQHCSLDVILGLRKVYCWAFVDTARKLTWYFWQHIPPAANKTK